MFYSKKIEKHCFQSFLNLKFSRFLCHLLYMPLGRLTVILEVINFEQGLIMSIDLEMLFFMFH